MNEAAAETLDNLKPADLVTTSGERWLDRRRNLRPRWFLVWTELALCHFSVLVGLSLVAWVSVATDQLWLEIAAIAAAAGWIGFWLHALGCFGHEAAHYNLAPSRPVNEWIANLTIFPLFGPTVVSYRRFHWEHHKHLGDPADTEISYVDCMSPARMFALFTGLRLVQALVDYLGPAKPTANLQAREGDPSGQDPDEEITGLTWFGLLRTALLHLGVVAALLLSGFPGVALTWVVAVVVVYPACNTIRQTLEHRHLDAGCDVDFRTEPHGPNTHMFGKGAFARYFGAAGFNGHLLHHIDPTVSYTNFTEFEEFLDRAGLGQELTRKRVSYFGAFRRALRAALDD